MAEDFPLETTDTRGSGLWPGAIVQKFYSKVMYLMGWGIYIVKIPGKKVVLGDGGIRKFRGDTRLRPGGNLILVS